MQRILALTLTLGLLALPVHAHDETHSIANGGPGGARLDEYWTEERMKAAVPMPLPVLSEEEFNQIHPGDDPEEVDGSVPGAPYMVDVSEFPFRAGGKLFFTLPDGSDSSCSGQFVAANVVMTAAHCLRSHATGVWFENFIFMRGYNRGFGTTFLWRCAMTPLRWSTLESGHFKFDYGFINTQGTVEHWLRLKQNIPYDNVTAVGYPTNYENGQRMYAVEGRKGRIWGGVVSMLHNPFNESASGGAWIGDLRPGDVADGNFAVGLNSHGPAVTTNVMASPVFDEETAELAERTADSCREDNSIINPAAMN